MGRGTSDELSRDIHRLGGLLGEAIRRLAGEEAFALVEAMRSEAKRLRAEPSADAARRLLERLAPLPLPDLRTLIRAFSVYFDLINLAEQQARMRTLRQRRRKAEGRPIAETPGEALERLSERGVTAGALADYLRRAEIVPVFTAHPTEARRRSTLEKLWRIAAELDRIERTDPLPDEQAAALRAIAEEVEGLWLSEPLRPVRPTVLDEVRQSLRVVERALFDVVPRLYRALDDALDRAYPEHAWGDVPSFLRFGSWIGGDRDGNPFVTPAVTAEALRLQQEMVLRHYLDRLADLQRRLSHSARLAPPGGAFLEALESELARFPEAAAPPESEPYRRKCRVIAARLRRTLDWLPTAELRWGEAPPPPPEGVYTDRAGLRADLVALRDALRHGGATATACGPLHDLIRLVDVFGVHMLTLDVRQHSAKHDAAVAEVFRHAGVCGAYLDLEPEERFALLARELEDPRPLIPAHLPYSDETAQVVGTFRTVEALVTRRCPEAIENAIISMTMEPAHILQVLLLAREADLFRPGRFSRLNVIPLFETLEELRAAPEIMRRLFALPVYRDHLRLRGDLQEVMIGYSDSNKESGFLQSAWALYRVERELVEAGRSAGVAIRIFHGRGGAVGRGGGPANRAILAQPRGVTAGRIRMTEQGEVIADRYAHPGVAERHLGQVVHAVLLASFPTAEERPDPSWAPVVDRLAASAREHYRALVYDTPEFLTYFEQATPLAEISQLNIGSRPARRGGDTGIETLRAIPWVFSWMQSRHTLPGWYGLGSALADFLAAEPDGLETLRTMYARWPFWRTAIDNAQMILSKGDLTIARLYADLVEDRALADRIFDRIASEYRRTVEGVCLVTDQSELLENVPVLRHSIDRRNPYVDSLSFLQLALIRRLRSPDPGADRDALRTAVLESINGIAAGLKNTG